MSLPRSRPLLYASALVLSLLAACGGGGDDAGAAPSGRTQPQTTNSPPVNENVLRVLVLGTHLVPLMNLPTDVLAFDAGNGVDELVLASPASVCPTGGLTTAQANGLAWQTGRVLEPEVIHDLVLGFQNCAQAADYVINGSVALDLQHAARSATRHLLAADIEASAFGVDGGFTGRAALDSDTVDGALPVLRLTPVPGSVVANSNAPYSAQVTGGSLVANDPATGLFLDFQNLSLTLEGASYQLQGGLADTHGAVHVVSGGRLLARWFIANDVEYVDINGQVRPADTFTVSTRPSTR